MAQRTFTFDDGADLGLCEMLIRVVPEYRNSEHYDDVSHDEVDRRTEEARRFLIENDWDPLIASITAGEIEAEFAADQARRSEPMADGTLPPPAAISGAATDLIWHRVSDEFERAGHLHPGVALEAAGGPCGGTTEGPTP
ncbi:hypothetical protein [Agromyces neolithicus]|uniref:Uncharacterized protein n=1 Tax=Agromyces neolithicus TaxID=269420 RepID=A0ABP4Y0Y0_9MICO